MEQHCTARSALTRVGVGLLVLGGLTACVTNPSVPPMVGFGTDPRQWTDAVPTSRVSIPDRFHVDAVVANPPRDEIWRCVPQASAASPSGFQPSPATQVAVIGHTRSSRLFMWSRGLGVCVERTQAGFPVLAAEAFVGTIDPIGVSEPVATQWRRQMAARIAQRGRVKVAYVFANGNATFAEYWVTPDQPLIIHYSSQFYRAGAWEGFTSDEQFRDSGLQAVRTTVLGGRSVKGFLLAHRFEVPAMVPPAGIPTPPPGVTRPKPSGMQST